MFGRVVTTFSLLAWASSASAAPVRIEIAGDACDLGSLAAEIEQIAPESAPSTVRVETTRQGDGVVAAVWFPDHPEGQRGPRTVVAASCTQLVDSIALVIAMALPGDARAPIVDDEPTLSVRAAVALGEPHRVAIAGYVTGGSTLGMRAQLVVGARVGLGAYSLGLEGHADAPEDVATSEIGSVHVSRAELAVAGCRHLGSLGLCATVSGGTIHGQGIGLHTARSAHTPVVTTGLRVCWERAIAGPVSVRAFVETRALLTSTTFDVDYMPVWQSERVEGSGGLGLLAHFL